MPSPVEFFLGAGLQMNGARWACGLRLSGFLDPTTWQDQTLAGSPTIQEISKYLHQRGSCELSFVTALCSLVNILAFLSLEPWVASGEIEFR